jgi:hypothetical protein
MKLCSKCKKEKPLQEFYKMKKAPDGHGYSCKVCWKQHIKERRKTEEFKKWEKEYTKRNYKKLQAKWKNDETHRERNRRHYMKKTYGDYVEAVEVLQKLEEILKRKHGRKRKCEENQEQRKRSQATS